MKKNISILAAALCATLAFSSCELLSRTPEPIDPETFPEEITVQQPESEVPTTPDYASYAGVWVGESDKFTLTANEENLLYFEYNSFSFGIEHYINTADIKNNSYRIEYLTYYDEEPMVMEMVFHPDVIVIEHLPKIPGEGFTEKTTYHRYIHSEATLELIDYMPDNNCYGYYTSSCGSIEVGREAGLTWITLILNSGSDAIRIDRYRALGSMALGEAKIAPDTPGGNTVTFNLRNGNSYGSYLADHFGTAGKVTVTFENNNSISYKLTDCTFTVDSYEGTMYLE